MARVQVLCGRERCWLLNEKGALALAAALPSAAPDFENRVNRALAVLELVSLRECLETADAG